MPALKSRETLSSHGSELKTQKPESRPTAKQVASLLNAAERETGPEESSRTGLVFMIRRVVGIVDQHGQKGYSCLAA